MNADTHSIVSAYYGSKLKSSADLKTSACCPVDAAPAEHRAILAQLHPTVLDKFYGCGSPIPSHLEGCTVLDLGCGTGRDAFVAAKLVGEKGKVIGIDMTDEQLSVAREYEHFHAERFFGDGNVKNTDFRKGYIEDLKAAGIDNDSTDVVISNCVCNLSPDKKAVFSEVARVLKQGGELYFSDVYADRRLSEAARNHPTLVSECLGGALYLEDFRRVLAEVGLVDVRVVSSAPVVVRDPQLAKLVPGVKFYSLTVRAFKLAALEDRRENYGQAATYLGDGCFTLDGDYRFESGVPLAVDGNTAAILTQARFFKLFKVSERGPHIGLFSPETEGGALAAMMGNGKTECRSAKPSEVVSQPARVRPSGCGGGGCC